MHSKFITLTASLLCSLSLASCASTTTPSPATATAETTTPEPSTNPADVPEASEMNTAPETQIEDAAPETQNAAAETGDSLPESDSIPAETLPETSAATPTESTESTENVTSATTSDAPTSAHPTVVVPAETEMTPIEKLLANGDFAGARALALKDLKSGKAENSNAYWAIIEKDPMLSHTLDEEVRPHGTNTISALGGGSTVSFKYKDSSDESAKAALKPDQDLRQTMYRSGIAYYRICQILGCSFDTPVTRPARFSKANFNALYNASDSSKNKGYRSKFEHLIWAKEEGTTYLYTGYKEWISPFTSFPIEVTSAWSPYLKNPDKSLPDIKTFLKNILSGGREGAVKELGKLVEYAGDMTTRDLLRQISDVILLDYLTNNWDRFAGEQSNFGANCHFQPGGIIAIDNDAAFPAWHAPRVVRRLNLVEAFSREFVENLRLLDPDELLIHLFPNPTKEERKSFERFKERRRDALKYIDDLIKKKGEDKVLVF